VELQTQEEMDRSWKGIQEKKVNKFMPGIILRSISNWWGDLVINLYYYRVAKAVVC